MSDQLLTVAEVAKQLRCSPSPVYDLIRRGKLEAIDIGAGDRASYRISERAVAAFLAGNEVETEQPAERKRYKPRLTKPQFLKVK